MPPDPELVRALRAAVERDPDSLPLRLHLAGMLLDLGAEAEALEQYAHVLQRDPANADAADVAVVAINRDVNAAGTSHGNALETNHPPRSVALHDAMMKVINRG